MPRQSRIDPPFSLHHVFSRGNNRSALFHDEEDFQFFLTSLRRARERFPFHVLAYGLMSNHYHFEVQILDTSLAKVMHYVNSLYAQRFNRRYRTSGHRFENRYRNILVLDDNYVLRLSRYIHLNPVKAGMVQHPQEYRWSSFRAYQGAEDPLVSKEFILGYFGRRGLSAEKAYLHFVEEGMARPEEFTEAGLRRVRTLGEAVRTSASRTLAPQVP